MAQSSDGEDFLFDNVDEALTFLEKLKTGKIGVRSQILESVIQAVDYLSRVSSTRGLVPDDLKRLVNVIILKNDQLKIARTLRLVKCLIPSTVVPEEAALIVISVICANKVPKSIKVQLFKWVLAVYCYDVQASKTRIQKIYDIVFCFIFDTDVCEFASHLLYIITRKCDVTRSRIRQLTRLSKNGKKPYLAGLLTLYQVYRAEVLRILPKGRRIFHPPTNWRDCFQKVKENNIELEMGPFLKHCSKGVVNGFSVALDRDIETYNDYRDMMAEVDTKYSVVEIVCSKNRRQIFSSYRGDLLRLRLENWIQVVGYDFCLAEDKLKLGADFLENVAETLKELPEEVLDGKIFLREYSTTWNGFKNKEMIFSFISTLELYEFDVLHETVLENLETLFFTGSTAYQCKYIRCLNDLCNNWILYKLPAFDLDEEIYEEGKNSIKQLQLYINTLCSCALTQEEKPNCLIIAAALEFYNDTLRLAILGLSTFLVWPEPILIYVSLFSFSTFVVSELCNLMVNYQKAIRVLKNKTIVDPELVNRINSYIIDVSTCLWRGTAYEIVENSLLFKDKFLPLEVADSVPTARSSFLFYRHPAFIIYTLQFLRERRLFSCELEDVQNVMQLREQFFQFLNRPECQGLLNFLHTFINMDRRLP